MTKSLRGNTGGYMPVGFAPTSDDSHEGDITLQDIRRWFTKRTAFYLNVSVVGVYWDLFQVLLGVFSIVMYVVEMYEDPTTATPLAAWMYILEIFFTIMFLVDLVWSFLAAEKKLTFLTSAPCLIDVGSILPVITLPRLRYGRPGVLLQFLRLLRFFRCTRVLEVSAGGRHGSLPVSDTSIRRQFVVVGWKIVTFIMLAAGFVHAAERAWPGTMTWVQAIDADCNFESFKGISPSLRPEVCQLDYFTAVYFAVVTTITVGYGDVYPASIGGRAVVIGVLLPIFIIVPLEAFRLMRLFSRVSKYSQAFPGSAHGHVLLCGELTGTAVYNFLTEWYHADHGEQMARVVILQPTEPDPILAAALAEPRFDQLVHYIQGTPMKPNDLKKAALFEAQAVFVKASRGVGEDPAMIDASALLTVRLLKSTCPWVPVHVELLCPDSSTHVWADWDSMICVQELRFALMARAAVIPGITTMVSNFLGSSSQVQGVDDAWIDPTDRQWIGEYGHGSGQELYRLPFSPVFNKQFFNEAAHIMYTMWGICLVGVETQRTRPQRREEEILADEKLSVDDRAKKLAEHRAQILGFMNDKDVDDAEQTKDVNNPEVRYQRLMEERRFAADSVILINPKHYCIREGDRAIVIAENMRVASHVRDWDGGVPSHLLDACSLTSSDKRTWAWLHQGRGPAIPVHSTKLVTPARVSGVDPDAISGAVPGRRSSFVDVRPTPTSVLQSLVTDSAEFMCGHIVVCGPGIKQVESLTHLLYALFAQSRLSIVLLCPEAQLSSSIAMVISKLCINPDEIRRLRIVLGRSINQRDLERAGVPRAQAVLVVRDNGIDAPIEPSQTGVEDSYIGYVTSLATTEAEALFTVCLIESQFPKVRVVLEIDHAAVMQYMLFKPHDDMLPRQLWPQYASGRAFVSGCLGNLLVSSYYNQSLVPILKRLIGHVEPPKQSNKSPAEPSPVLSHASPTLKRTFSLRQQSMAVHLPVKKEPPIPENDTLVFVPVPREFVGKAYGDVFAELAIVHGYLCLGVFRSEAIHDAPLPYVVTNPVPTMLLHQSDHLYMLTDAQAGVPASPTS